MKDWKNILMSSATSILEAITIIDAEGLQLGLVVDEHKRLLGTVTDGDVRRGILKGVALGEPVSRIMNAQPKSAGQHEDRNALLERMKRTGVHHMPIVDCDRILVGLEVIDSLIMPLKRDNWVVLMAGGMGTRLRPLTDDAPKPLLHVGGRPILETILESLVEAGFHRFFISINYKGELIREHFGDGSSWGVEISYLHEHERLGTAGPLSLLPATPDQPVIVMNGDVLTRVSFSQLLSSHDEQGSAATMCVREYDFQVPYGVVKIDRHRLVSIEEKPVHRYFVNAGIYVLNPEVLPLIASGEIFDMPDLFKEIIRKGYETTVFPIREYWLDIGRLDDFERAAGEYGKVFS